MTDAVEAGAGLAWRLLATLEGGSLLLAMTALIAYTASLKLKTKKRHTTVNSVLSGELSWSLSPDDASVEERNDCDGGGGGLCMCSYESCIYRISNENNALGRELKRRLDFQGCTVRSVTSGAASLAETDQVDCLLVIGAESKGGLTGISNLVSEDVYENLNLLETLSRRVKSGGCIAWVCAGDATGAYGNATAAFDTIIRISLQHVAKNIQCEPIWVGRCDSVEQAVEKIVAELFPCTIRHRPGFAIRNAAHKISVFLSRWLKMAT